MQFSQLEHSRQIATIVAKEAMSKIFSDKLIKHIKNHSTEPFLLATSIPHMSSFDLKLFQVK